MHKLAAAGEALVLGPYFRHERPQAGRFRQFNQIGAEAIGTDSPLVDAELIVLLDELLRELGVAERELRLGSLGSPASRERLPRELRATCASTRPSCSDDVRERIDAEPAARLRRRPRGNPGGDGGGADDARAPRRGRRRALRRGPARCSTHAGSPTSSTAPWSAASTTTRAPCSSSTRTALGAQCGARRRRPLRRPGRAARRPADAGRRLGGRGRADPARARRAAPTSRGADVFVAAADGQRERAFALVRELRRAGLQAELDLAGRSFKGQMKQADRSAPGRRSILDERGAAQLRDMCSGEQREVAEPLAERASRS